MSTSPVAPTRPVDGTRVINTLVAAFASDPIIRWIYPDERYGRHFPEMLQLFGGERLSGSELYCTADYEGAAMWLAPGATFDEEGLGALLEQSIDPERHEDLFAFLGQIEEHHPEEPHWYLPFIGVDPAFQGLGHGSTLLREALARCDREGLPAYLEASSPRSRPLYERHGFVVTGEVQAADSPPMWPMWRPASSPGAGNG